ncbi:MAG TPA: GIY-YIG nuclease family protein [Acidobacteriaceae bacterium]
MPDPRHYYIYMLTNSTRRTLYTGVTNTLRGRIYDHRHSEEGFTARYRAFRLVHYEVFVDIRNAIAREKEIKGWRREKKNALVQQHNPTWRDLATDAGLESWPSVDDRRRTTNWFASRARK